MQQQQLLVSACRSQEDGTNKGRPWGFTWVAQRTSLVRGSLWDETFDSWKFSKLGHQRLIPLYCCRPVTKLCPTLFNPTNYSMPGFPVLHHLPGFAQIRVHWVSDAIWLSHLLPPTSPLVLNLSQHQDLFQCIGSSHQVPKVLELQRWHQSFQWIFRVDFL